MTLRTVVDALFVGMPRDRWPGRPPSAIGKRPSDTPLDLTTTGFVGDAQADLRVHGGPERAVHHYPADYYPEWRTELGDRETFAPGGFGENVSTTGLSEDDVCIGDVFYLGGALVQISQGRQPCWKLSAYVGEERMAYLIQKTARTGWYYRVLEPGQVGLGDAILLQDRPQPDWSVRRVTLVRFDRTLDEATARAIAALPELNEGWREAFARKAGGQVENTEARLDGPLPTAADRSEPSMTGDAE